MTPFSTADQIPLYARVAEDLRARILSGAWVPGDRIPPELELCETYHVSRITVRRGIEELVRERLVTRKRAKGTFVNDWQAERPDDHVTSTRSFTQEMSELGKTATTLWADVRVEPADARMAKLLELQAGDPVLALRRTRGTGAKPFVYFATHIPYRTGYPLDSAAYYESLYELLRGFGITPNQGNEYIEAMTPPVEVQEALGIAHNEPVLKRTRMMRQADDDYREHTACYYVGSEYRYRIDFG